MSYFIFDNLFAVLNLFVSHSLKIGRAVFETPIICGKCPVKIEKLCSAIIALQCSSKGYKMTQPFKNSCVQVTKYIHWKCKVSKRTGLSVQISFQGKLALES